MFCKPLGDVLCEKGLSEYQEDNGKSQPVVREGLSRLTVHSRVGGIGETWSRQSARQARCSASDETADCFDLIIENLKHREQFGDREQVVNFLSQA